MTTQLCLHVGSDGQKSFDYYIIASGITDVARKRALFLCNAGDQVQELFDTLTDTGDTYEAAKNALDNYFAARRNASYERYMRFLR